MDVPLVPVVHGEEQHVGRSSFSSTLGGRDSSIHPTRTPVSAEGPEEMPHTTDSQKKSIQTLLLKVCPGPGALHCPQVAFIRGFLSSLDERTLSPATGRGERDAGVITWIPTKFWVVAWLTTGGHKVLPASRDKRKARARTVLLLTGRLIRDCKMMPLQGWDWCLCPFSPCAPR